MALNMQGQTANKDTKIGELTFNTKVIDYGKIEHNANGERQFTFKNTGNAPVVISNVKTSCGCTVPTYPKTAILPGKSETITVKYATNRIGRFSKSITVISNAKNPTQILKIKGEVLKTNL
jgi:hypothetical protein